jgi:hypothetical protein
MVKNLLRSIIFRRLEVKCLQWNELGFVCDLEITSQKQNSQKITWNEMP